MTQKQIIYFSFLLLSLFTTTSGQANTSFSPLDSRQLYQEMQLDSLVDYTAFHYAIEGYNRLPVPRRDTLTLIDFTKSSTVERLFILDLKQKKLLLSSHVSHGRNSGEDIPTSFSNTPGSFQSSLGFFLTGDTYHGRNGYSLLLDGLEAGINDKARERAIVIHGADYCNPSTATRSGRLGRSLGCPALPRPLTRTIINTIKHGTLLFIFGHSPDYPHRSPILSSPNKTST